ncbi:MAG: ATP-binding protein [Clostridiales Family XIII bacterium]|jgi:hypothetical protein|nr:ATP-binding protein [Clostridiales Family XIII bacterium]
MREMPIGIQDFEKLRTGDYAYVDKTEYVYNLARTGTPFFLGRPRRFGKSLLVSTLRAYFEGKKELFEGLAMEKLEKDWISYPVFHIDLNVMAYRNVDDLEAGLDANLRQFEKTWNPDGQPTRSASAVRFYDLIQTACEKSGQKVVVLIDEYDRPLTQTMERGKENDDIRSALKGFYGVLKSSDRWLRFVLLTGVTKFSKVTVNSNRPEAGEFSSGAFQPFAHDANGDRRASVFSDLNMLRDISMENAYSGICGISAKELEDNFGAELEALGACNGMTYDETVAEMKRQYDGYRFSKQGEGIFNPFSVLNTLAKKEFAYYWFKTGTPTFLVEQIRQGSFDPLRFAEPEGVRIPAEAIDDYRVGNDNPIPLLYQSGYLTIAGYKNNRYILDFPNEEVRYGFLNELLPVYTYRLRGHEEFFADYFIDDLRAGSVDGFMTRMRSFFANIPYELNDQTERHYQLVFTLLGQYARAEVHSARGRTDAAVETPEAVYVFEFKLNGTAEEALKQIDEKEYALPYEAGNRKVIKIGAEFDKDTRNISRWLVALDG